MKKFLSVILSVAMLTASIVMPISASAEDTLLFPVLDFENVPTDLMNDKGETGWYHSNQYLNPGSIKSNYVGVLPGYNSAGALAVNCGDDGDNYRHFEFVVGTVVNGAAQSRTSGKYRMTFDLKPGEGTFVLEGFRGIASQENMGTKIINLAAGTLDKTKWYQVEVYIDLDNKQSKYFVTDAEKNLVTSGGGAYNENGTEVINFGRALSGGTAEGTGRLDKSFAADNIAFYSTTIETLPTEPTIKPEAQVVTLTDDRITITAGGAVATDWKAVAPNVSEIAIDFGTTVVGNTLTETSVQITSEAGAISATRGFENGVYTFTAPVIAPETTYTITLTDDIEYANGAKLTPYTKTFTTTSNTGSTADTLLFPVLDFENVDTSLINSSETNGWMNSEQFNKPGSIMSHYVGIVSGYNSTGALAIDVSNNYRMFEYVLTDYDAGGTLIPRPEAMYRMTFDLKPGEGTFELEAYRGTTGWENSGTDIISLPAGELNANEWYQVELFLDLPNDQIRYFITNADKYLVKSGTVAYNANLCVLQFGRTIAGGTSSAEGKLGKSFAVDNIAFYSSELTAVPEEPTIKPAIVNLTASNFSITRTDGTVNENLVDVSPAVDEIQIDFATAIIKSGVDATTVKLVKCIDETTEIEIYTSRRWNGFVYSVIPGQLDELSDYKLKISNGIVTEDERTVIPYEFSFTTGRNGTLITDSGDYLANFDFNTGTTASLPVETDGHNGFVLGGSIIGTGGKNDTNTLVQSMASGVRGVQYSLPEIATSGKVRVEMSVKITDPAVNLIIAPVEGHGEVGVQGQHRGIVTFGGTGYAQAGKILVGGNNIGKTDNEVATYIAADSWTSQWYDVSMTFDLSGSLCDVTITDEAGTEIVNKNDVSRLNANTNLGTITIRADSQTPSESQKFLIDDFKISKIYSTVPSITTNSIKIHEDAEEITNFNDVSTLADKIEIDFGQQIKTEHANDDYIYLTKKNSSDKIAYNGFSGNGIYTMVTANMLEKNTTYTLHIEPVANVSGLVMSRAFTMDFTTGAGAVKAILKSISKNSSPITAISELSPSTDTTIDFDYKNSTGNLAKLNMIVAHYNGNQMLKADYLIRDVAGNITTNPFYGVNYTTPVATDITGLNKTKVMLWDSFDKMSTLSPSLELTASGVASVSGTTNTSATFESDVRVDEQTGEIIISGKADKGGQVTVQIIDDAVTLQSFTQSPDGAKVLYVNDTVAGDNGTYSFNVKPATSGGYNVYVSYGGKVNTHNLYYVLPTEYEGLVQYLNGKTSDEFFTKLSEGENANIIGLKTGIAFDRTVSDMFFGVVDYNASQASNAALINACASIKQLNSGNSTGVFEYLYDELAKDATFKKYMDKHIVNYVSAQNTTETPKSFFEKALLGKNLNMTNLKDKATEALIFTAVKYPNGNMNIKTIFTDYKTFMGLTSIRTDSDIYTYLAGKTYSDMTTLKNAYNGTTSGGNGPSGPSGPSEDTGNGKNNITSNGFSSVTVPSISPSVSGTQVLGIQFDDLVGVEWAYSAISELYEMGVVNGFSQYEYKPNNTVKREEFIKMLICACLKEADIKCSEIFIDVIAGAWYERYVGSAYANKMVNGVGNNKFGIGLEISRQDMAVMIYNAMRANGYTPTGAELTFADKDMCADYAKVAIAELSAIGVINGVGDNMFSPLGKATRAEAAVIIHRAISYLR